MFIASFLVSQAWTGSSLGPVFCFGPLIMPRDPLSTQPCEFRNVFPFNPKPFFLDRYQLDAFLFIPSHSKFLRLRIGSFYFCLCVVIIMKNQSSPSLTPTFCFVLFPSNKLDSKDWEPCAPLITALECLMETLKQGGQAGKRRVRE